MNDFARPGERPCGFALVVINQRIPGGAFHMKRPLISIIIPVYKVERYLDRCVKSVLAQDFPDFELLLIDDGSPDRCGKMCDNWAGQDERIRVYHQTNRGISGARNCGLDHVRGRYISFIDADDWVTKDYLSYLMSLFVEQCAVTACNHTVVRNGKKKNNVKAGRERRILTRKEAYEEVLFHGCVDVSGWGKLYKREVFDGFRFPEGKLFEDTYLFGDILNKTSLLVFGNKPCYFYEMHEESLVNRSFTEMNLDYIEASKKLAQYAVEAYPDLKVGAVRRINHARLSVLRYMEKCDGKYHQLRNRMRKEILKEAPVFIRDNRTPKRDKIAIGLLKAGFGPFYLGWKLYSLLR